MLLNCSCVSNDKVLLNCSCVSNDKEFHCVYLRTSPTSMCEKSNWYFSVCSIYIMYSALAEKSVNYLTCKVLYIVKECYNVA